LPLPPLGDFDAVLPLAAFVMDEEPDLAAEPMPPTDEVFVADADDDGPL
jgi:hypothetical protein